MLLEQIAKNKFLNKMLICLVLTILLFNVFYSSFSLAITDSDKSRAAQIIMGLSSRFESLIGKTESTITGALNTILNADSKNDIKISGNTITFEVTDRNIVNQAFSSILSDSDINTFLGASDVIVIREVSSTSSSTSGNNHTAQSSTSSMTGAEIINQIGPTGSGQCQSLTVFNDNTFNKLINLIKQQDSRNSVTVSGNKVVISATSKDSVRQVFAYNFCQESDANLIANNSFSSVINVQIISTTPAEGETDNRTEEQKIVDAIVEQYGYTPATAQLIVDNNQYTVNSDGSVTVTADQDTLLQYGASQTIITENDDGNSLLGTLADAAGGILLKPVLFFVNFVADAILKAVGFFMTGEWRSNDDLFSPEEIFAGNIELLSIDFIGGNNSDEDWLKIQSTIAAWYKALRLFAIIGLLSVLIYTGIKILISSVAKDKAKYKEWLINWFVAAALLFSMHYIMSFIITVIGQITNLMKNASLGINLVSEVRSHINLTSGFSETVGYEVMYIALIVYTIKFTFIYLKRVLNMAFLTLIAPIVALTYPIDKINDGQAQGFNMWLKEYIFNALLQPVHLLMYYILVASASNIAQTNPLYGIVVLMFMSEAERLLKKIFGFDKATGGTVGGMTGAFAAGALASSVKNIARLGGGKLLGGRSGNSSSSGDDYPGAILKDADTGALPNMSMASEDVDINANSVDTTSGGSSMLNANVNPSAGGGPLSGGAPQTPSSSTTPIYGPNGSTILSTVQRPNAPQGTIVNTRGVPISSGSPQAGGGTQIVGGPQSGSGPQPAGGPQLSGNSRTGAAQPASLSHQTPEVDPLANIHSPLPTMTNSQRIREMAKSAANSRLGRGASAVGRKIAKPIYDFDKSGKENAKRFARNVGRIAVGASLGVTAAAVQAGISITDGKYSPMEGLAAFGAGFAGGGVISNTAGGLANTFSEGYNSGDSQQAREARMAKYQEDWSNRDDVIKFFKDNYGDDWKKVRERAKNEYVPRGVTDVKEIKQGMKYANTLSGPNADREAVRAMNFKENLKSQSQLGAIYDESKKQKYIETYTRGLTGEAKSKEEKRLNALFNQVKAYNDAIRK